MKITNVKDKQDLVKYHYLENTKSRNSKITPIYDANSREPAG